MRVEKIEFVSLLLNEKADEVLLIPLYISLFIYLYLILYLYLNLSHLSIISYAYNHNFYNTSNPFILFKISNNYTISRCEIFSFLQPNFFVTIYLLRS